MNKIIVICLGFKIVLRDAEEDARVCLQVRYEDIAT